MVMPMTCSPSRRSSPATTELSTPPDMATAMVFSGIGRRQLSQASHHRNPGVDQRLHLLYGVRPAQRKTHTRSRLLARESDHREHVRGLGSPARTRRPARDREALQVERNQQGFAIDAVKTHIRGVADSLGPCPIDMGAGYPRENSLLQAVAQER